MATTARGLALTGAYQTQLRRMMTNVAAVTGRLWEQHMSIDGNFDDQFDRLDATLAPIASASQRQAATLAAAYVGAYLTAEAGSPAAPIDPAAYTTEHTRGVNAAEVYRRALTTTRIELAAGADSDTALAAGRARLEQAVSTDIALAGRQAIADTAGPSNDVTSFERIADSGCCALCADADGERFGSEDIPAIHPACGCVAEPVVDNGASQLQRDAPTVDDPNQTDVEALDQGEPVSAVHVHDELGPVLYRRGDEFAQI